MLWSKQEHAHYRRGRRRRMAFSAITGLVLLLVVLAFVWALSEAMVAAGANAG
jgi:hypothetical protein